MKKVILSLIGVFAMCSPAMASGYASAGCGLGSQLIKDDGFVQIFAATTNATFANQLFAISSGTSNCGKGGGIAKNDAQQEIYVSSNFDSLSQEMAQGSGEHLSAFAKLLGCSDASVAHFGSVMQKNYREMDDSSPVQLLGSVKSTVSSDSQLSKSCGA